MPRTINLFKSLGHYDLSCSKKTDTVNSVPVQASGHR